MNLYILLILGIIAIFAGFLVKKLKFGVRESLRTKLGDFDIIEIKVPKNQEESKDSLHSALAAENMFASLHGLLREDASDQEHFAFEIVSDGSSGIKFYAAVPKHISKFVESQIYAQYPTCQLKVVSDYTDQALQEGGSLNFTNILLNKEEFFPIKTFRDFEIDPISGITSAMSDIGLNDKIWLQFLIRPLADGWQKKGYDYVEAMRTGTDSTKKAPFEGIVGNIITEFGNILTNMLTGFFSSPTPTDPRAYGKQVATAPRLNSTQELEIRSIEDKLFRLGFEVEIRVFSFADTNEASLSHLRNAVASLKQFSSSNLNTFISSPSNKTEQEKENYKNRAFEDGNSFALSVSELATVVHLPTSAVETPNISWVYSKKSEPPVNLPTKDCIFIGETLYRSQKIRFGLKNDDDRLRHMYLIGKSGTGKSTLFLNMISQDIANGQGVGVLDPHGDLIENVLDYIPPERMNDVIYFDPSDTERPVGLNLLEMSDQSQKNLMASALVSAIHHHFDYSWGPRLEYLLNYAILTLLEVPGTSMLGITRLLEDDNYRKYIMHWVKDPVVLKFWDTEYKAMKGNQKLVTEAIAPIQNKVNRFLASTTIRNILGQKHSTLDMWDAMNNGKILLMNLSKGKIGEDNANLLGALMVSRIQFMALQRAKIPSNQRRPFYLYVDEFQNFATGSFESILSESRKYGLGLYLTHQYTAQLPEDLLKAVFGNVGTIATFSLGAPDARALANEFQPYFDEEDIISLERFHIYMKLMMNGMTSLPFSAEILRPFEPGMEVVKKYPENKNVVIEMSRQKYGVESSGVEGKINKWVETDFNKGIAIAQEKHKLEASGQSPEDKINNQVEDVKGDISL